ncbi:MAG: hypothetical protein MR757_00780 [Proteobacteria bacterium]|nr:hypothetical protein [Pseudomonadota bacterium]
MKTSYQDSTFRIFLDFAKKAISDSGTHLKSRQFDDEVEDGGAVFFVFDSELIARKFVELACGHGPIQDVSASLTTGSTSALY